MCNNRVPQVKGQEVLMVKQRECKHPLPINTTLMLLGFGYVVDSEIDIKEQEEEIKRNQYLTDFD